MPLHLIQHGPRPLDELAAAVKVAEDSFEEVVQVIEYANRWGILTRPTAVKVSTPKRPARPRKADA